MERKLIIIDMGDGQGVQMYEDEARALGLLVEKKQQPQAETKEVRPAENKAAPTPKTKARK